MSKEDESEIELIYDVNKEYVDDVKIFGKEFVKNNKKYVK